MQTDENLSFDQFSHDLSLALEETSRSGACSRWGLRRRTRSTGNLRKIYTLNILKSKKIFFLACPPLPTECDSNSDPSNDTIPNDSNNNDQCASGTMNANNSILSDSDDRRSYAFAFKIRQTPMCGNFESDSLNENFSPSRPNIRRKRKFKRMAVEYETTPSTPHAVAHSIFPITMSAKKRVLKYNQENFRSNMFFGKRKRPHRERFADYHSSSVPRQRGGFLSQKDNGHSYLEHKSRNRASSMSTARGQAIEKILPLNKSILSKIEKISQSRIKFNFTPSNTIDAESFHLKATPVVHFQSVLKNIEASSDINKHSHLNEMRNSVIKEDIKANFQKIAQKSGSFESALKKKNKQNPMGPNKHKHSRILKLQFDDQNFMDCGNMNDFLSSSSLSSSDSEAEETNESDHEGDDELTDWPGHDEAMVNFASKNDFKRANKKSTKMPQIKQQDDMIQDDDTLMSADEIHESESEHLSIKMHSHQMSIALRSMEVYKNLNLPSHRMQASNPINIVGANSVGDSSSTSGVVADCGYGSSFATSYNHFQPIESEMSGETSNHFLSSSNIGFGEVREIRAGCRRIRDERPGFSIMTSFNEELLKYSNIYLTCLKISRHFCRFLKDEQQKQMKIFDIHEYDKILELAKLYSLNVTSHPENKCIILNKTR